MEDFVSAQIYNKWVAAGAGVDSPHGCTCAGTGASIHREGGNGIIPDDDRLCRIGIDAIYSASLRFN